MRRSNELKRVAAAVTAVSAVLLGFTPAATAAGKLVFWSWGGTFQAAQAKALFAPCAEKLGLTLVQDENPDTAKLIAAVKTNTVQWDIVDVVAQDYPILAAGNYLEKIDYSKFDSDELNAIDPKFRPDYGIATGLSAQGIAYRTDLGKADHPSSWGDFWNVAKFPGPRAVPQGTFSNPPWEAALVGDGVSPQNLYPIDFDRALKVLGRDKGSVKVWYTSTAQGVQALVNGDVDYAILPNGRVQQAQSQGAPIAFEYNQSLYQFDYLVVPKGAPDAEAAMKCLAYSQQTNPSLAFMKIIPYGMVNKAANGMLDPEYAKTMPSSDQNLSREIGVNTDFYAQPSGKGDTWLDYSIKLWNQWFASL